ncbi:hypothetical protein PEV8663_04454 [Pelagimonas varians]|uniref:Uncharacterized protein n=1 Tax=Pelagimonas varians TaxID=696760 RepID=A0A238L4Y2_9RHOB|nr:hypothetical protein PEV8663_04454 [Pelagimonas varians]
MAVGTNDSCRKVPGSEPVGWGRHGQVLQIGARIEDPGPARACMTLVHGRSGGQPTEGHGGSSGRVVSINNGDQDRDGVAFLAAGNESGDGRPARLAARHDMARHLSRSVTATTGWRNGNDRMSDILTSTNAGQGMGETGMARARALEMRRGQWREPGRGQPVGAGFRPQPTRLGMHLGKNHAHVPCQGRS